MINNKKVICKKCGCISYFYVDDEPILKKAHIIDSDSISINSNKSNYVCSECGHRHFKIENTD